MPKKKKIRAARNRDEAIAFIQRGGWKMVDVDTYERQTPLSIQRLVIGARSVSRFAAVKSQGGSYPMKHYPFRHIGFVEFASVWQNGHLGKRTW